MSPERCVHCGDTLSLENDSSPLGDHCVTGLVPHGLRVVWAYELCSIVDVVGRACQSDVRFVRCGTWPGYGDMPFVLLQFASHDVLLFPTGVACAPRSTRAFAAGESRISIDPRLTARVSEFFAGLQSGPSVGAFANTPHPDSFAFVQSGPDALCLTYSMAGADALLPPHVPIGLVVIDGAEYLLRYPAECWYPGRSPLGRAGADCDE